MLVNYSFFLCWKILRKYGVPKPKFDKSKYNKAGKEQHPVKVVSTKRPVTKPPTKEKSVLNSVRLVSSAYWQFLISPQELDVLTFFCISLY